MADGHLSKSLALDTNVLIDLAGGEPFAADFRRLAQEAGLDLLITRTVAAEIHFLALSGEDRRQDLARCALQRLSDWRITAQPITDVQKGYCLNFCSYVRDRRILPPNEANDARILAECAIAEIPAVVTSDRAILDADEHDLQLAFQDAGLPIVARVHPADMARSLSRRLR